MILVQYTQSGSTDRIFVKPWAKTLTCISRALKSHALGVRRMQFNPLTRSHAIFVFLTQRNYQDNTHHVAPVRRVTRRPTLPRYAFFFQPKNVYGWNFRTVRDFIIASNVNLKFALRFSGSFPPILSSIRFASVEVVK